MMKAIGKTVASLALAGALLAPAAQAFPEPQPVGMTPEGVVMFLKSLPPESVILRGMQGAQAECQGCSRGLAAAIYMDGLFDYYGYDYGATVRDYASAFSAPGGVSEQLYGVTQMTAFAGMMRPAVNVVRDGNEDDLVERGVLSREEVEAVKALPAR